jgi:ankyrin repeat protein
MFTMSKKFLFISLLCCFSASVVALRAMEEPAIDQPGDGIVRHVERDVCVHIARCTFADAQAYVAGLDRTNNASRQIAQSAQNALEVFSAAYNNYTREIESMPYDSAVDGVEDRFIVEPNATIIEQLIKMNAHGFRIAKIFIDILGSNYITAHGQSLLHLSARAGNEQLVEWLLSQLSEHFVGNSAGLVDFVNLRDPQGRTAVNYAHILNDDHGIVQMLSQYGHGLAVAHHAPLRYAPSDASAALAARQREERLRSITPVLRRENDGDKALLRG